MIHPIELPKKTSVCQVPSLLEATFGSSPPPPAVTSWVPPASPASARVVAPRRDQGPDEAQGVRFIKLTKNHRRPGTEIGNA